MLVIPAIDLRHGHCVRVHKGHYEDESVYFADPVRMAKLWRVMNAKSIHLVDHDTPQEDPEGLVATRAEIARIATALDIPVQTTGVFESMEAIESMLARGIYRVALPHTMDRAVMDEALARFSPSRVIASMSQADHESVAQATDLEDRGFRRIIISTRPTEGEGPDLDVYRQIAGALTKTRISAAGNVRGYRDLLALQAVQPLGLDSVIIGRAFYENRFPCQQFWCWHRKEDVNLDRFSTARLALQ